VVQVISLLSRDCRRGHAVKTPTDGTWPRSPIPSRARRRQWSAPIG